MEASATFKEGMMFDPRLPVARDGDIAIVTINQPEVRNALDLSLWQALQRTMAALSEDDDLRCVVIRGAGTQAFSAGADIGGFARDFADKPAADRYATVLHHGFQSIRLCRHPVVAMIMGACIGGGAGIATMCDFRVGGEGIRFGITARNLGIWYAYAEIDPIVQMVGTGVVNELLIEGRIFTGREAYEKGLRTRVVADTDVEAEAMALARRICEGSPISARFHKAALRKLRGNLAVPDEDVAAQNDFVLTEDFRAAYRAFLEKRKPHFTGR